MIRLKHRLVPILLGPCIGLFASAAGCTQPQSADVAPVAAVQQAAVTDIAKGAADLAKQCGIDVDCKADGIAEGNASISGVASVDAFFQSVLNYQTKADNLSAGIDAELAAIAGDFGIAADADLVAELNAQFAANLVGELTIENEPAHCAVDVKTVLRAQAKCDVSVDPGKASCKCEGACDVDASADVKCESSSELKCTFQAPTATCEGSCRGGCEIALKAAASCSGTCRGSCDGKCSAYAMNASGDTECAGSCEGMCEGSCESDVMADASCKGTCRGECTVTPADGNCQGAVSASCEASASAMVDCRGRCRGRLHPPKAKAECEASANAEAKLNVECTPPRLAVHYELKVVDVNVDVDVLAQARFEAGLKGLEKRLPTLLAAFARANSIGDAGVELIGDGRAAVKGGINAALDAAGEGDIRVVAGLHCALEEADNVETAIDSSTQKLDASRQRCTDLTAALNMGGV